MSDVDDFFAERPVPRRRARGAAAGLFVLFGVLVVLAVLAVVADVVTRSLVEQRAAAEIATSTGLDDVAVDVHGVSVLWQIAHGSLDDVTLSSGSAGDPVSFTVDVSDVPTDLEGTSGPVTGTLTADSATVSSLEGIESVGASVALGTDEITYSRSFDPPFIPPVAVDVTATPALVDDGRALDFAPTRASLPDVSVSLDLTPFLGDFAARICVAEQLPPGVVLTSVDVEPDRVQLGLRSDGLPLDSSALAAKGTCG
ncbi:DUF2993 domain-containing protein [Frigoribacterium sp. ACAM 257]|uniref:LmeA family phospholipid-binding protein n=1 Tax=Frigoribacterium sp. ACAM 257 TaxID=2508998 RepID=UPI0011B9EF5B|nr:DUF2993 domain-containing protein [Frigoribacterium sp. ACAM 257]TWX40465.1 DUF2993 domain-containing protein [Frigoribacterium sp. ACAM 257]